MLCDAMEVVTKQAMPMPMFAMQKPSLSSNHPPIVIRGFNAVILASTLEILYAAKVDFDIIQRFCHVYMHHDLGVAFQRRMERWLMTEILSMRGMQAALYLCHLPFV